MNRVKLIWARAWMSISGICCIGRLATYLASLSMPPYYGRVVLAKFNSAGYISNSTKIHHDTLSYGCNCYIGDGVTIYKDEDGGAVKLGAQVHLHDGSTIQTGHGGEVSIGDKTHIQPRCQISAYKASVIIGKGVEIAPNCAFYSYDHGSAADTPIRKQPLNSKGNIVIGDDAWLGFGVVVLNGVEIGEGAVIGASSVVTKNIPANVIAVGNPAKLVKYRDERD